MHIYSTVEQAGLPLGAARVSGETRPQPTFPDNRSGPMDPARPGLQYTYRHVLDVPAELQRKTAASGAPNMVMQPSALGETAATPASPLLCCWGAAVLPVLRRAPTCSSMVFCMLSHQNAVALPQASSHSVTLPRTLCHQQSVIGCQVRYHCDPMPSNIHIPCAGAPLQLHGRSMTSLCQQQWHQHVQHLAPISGLHDRCIGTPSRWQRGCCKGYANNS